MPCSAGALRKLDSCTLCLFELQLTSLYMLAYLGVFLLLDLQSTCSLLIECPACPQPSLATTLLTLLCLALVFEHYRYVLGAMAGSQSDHNQAGCTLEPDQSVCVCTHGAQAMGALCTPAHFYHVKRSCTKSSLDSSTSPQRV